jgi:CRISPR-associated protein Csy3
MALKKLPGVLSFQRGTIVSDGAFYNVFADGQRTPLAVIRHGIRGTQNVNTFVNSEGSTAKTGRREVSNIQVTDSAKLHPDSIALEVRFDLRFLDLAGALFACAPSKEDSQETIRATRDAIQSFVDKVKDSDFGPFEVAARYARNILNGRWLWRNRAVAESIRVRVSSGDELIADVPDALQIPLNLFGDYSEAEQRVARIIVDGMSGDRSARLSVIAEVHFGVAGAIEVFPSQNYIEDKNKGFARPLFVIGGVPDEQDENGVREMGQAALRDQKIANALRTFDTWYPNFAQRAVPIAIEPNGASLEAQEFFRGTAESSAFALMLKIADLDPDTEEGMFMLACLIRGGVYTGDKKDKKEAA